MDDDRAQTIWVLPLPTGKKQAGQVEFWAAMWARLSTGSHILIALDRSEQNRWRNSLRSRVVAAGVVLNLRRQDLSEDAETCRGKPIYRGWISKERAARGVIAPGEKREPLERIEVGITLRPADRDWLLEFGSGSISKAIRQLVREKRDRMV